MDPMSTPHAAIRLLDELSAVRIDPVVPKTEVFDRLLDLRNLVGDLPALVAVIDDSLRDVPGATLAPGAWWQDELRSLRTILGDALCPEAVS